MRHATRRTRTNLAPPAGGVTVRMYRHGLGDCFLLAFGREEQSPFFMLIDCGVIVGTPDPDPMMTRVVDDICLTTGNRIDLMVLTHEHWDHLSGFLQAKSSFERLRNNIGQLWLGWVEEPGNELARQIKSKYKRTRLALSSLAKANTASMAPAMNKVRSLLAFEGPAAAGSGREGTDDALAFAQELFGKKPDYCFPSKAPKTIAALPGVRFFVLGPPEDVASIGKETSKKEMYFGRQAYSAESAFFAAALGPESGMFESYSETERLSRPFDHDEAIDSEVLLSAKRRKGAHQELRDAYLKAQADGAGIDDEWMDTAGSLALQLDRGVNNTSLALAIELSPGGKVLLFPGDAQAGNWMSWSKLRWPDSEDPSRKIDINDLFARTVLYKVGHHGSHNATMKANGLERMNHPELAAMIPVDQLMAQDKKGWLMPYPDIFRALQAHARGRILQGAVKTGSPGPTSSVPQGVSAAEWAKFRAAVTEGPGALYWDYTIQA